MQEYADEMEESHKNSNECYFYVAVMKNSATNLPGILVVYFNMME